MIASDTHPVVDGLPAQKMSHRLLFDFAVRALIETGRCTFSVKSDSMAPLIRTGDQILAKSPVVIDRIAGQLFVYVDGTGLVVHRLIGRDGEKYIFQGDFCPWQDSPQASTAILAEVVEIKHQGLSLQTSDDGIKRLFGLTAGLLNVQRKIAVSLGIDLVNGRRGKAWQRMIYRGFRIPFCGLVCILDSLPWFFVKLQKPTKNRN